MKVWDLTSYKCVQDIDNENSKSSGQKSFECRGLLLMKDNVLLCGNGSKIVAHRPHKVEKQVNFMTFLIADKRVYGEHFTSFEGHAKIVSMLKPLNKVRFLSGSDDFSIKLWDLASQSCSLTFIGHQQTISDVVVYDSNTIISGDKQGTLKFWSLETGTILREIKAHETYISSIAVKSDKTLLTTHGGDPIVKFWSQ